MTSLVVEPVVLEGRFVRLEPARLDHAAGLAEVSSPEIFRYFMTLRPQDKSVEAMKAFLTASLAVKGWLTFTIIELATGKPVGTTSYLDIRAEHRGLEIGATWIGTAFQRTKVNPECKLLLIDHAFAKLGCVRVQLKTDARNLQSQGAIEKLGAKKEGVLRQHAIMPDGYIRDTVMYSILPSEWPAVKAGLLERLNSA